NTCQTSRATGSGRCSQGRPRRSLQWRNAYGQYSLSSVNAGPGGLTHALGLETLVEVDEEGAIAGLEGVALALGHGDGVAGLIGKEALGVHVHVEGGDDLGLLLADDLGEGSHGADGESEDGCGVHLDWF